MYFSFLELQVRSSCTQGMAGGGQKNFYKYQTPYLKNLNIPAYIEKNPKTYVTQTQTAGVTFYLKPISNFLQTCHWGVHTQRRHLEGSGIELYLLIIFYHLPKAILWSHLLPLQLLQFDIPEQVAM